MLENDEYKSVLTVARRAAAELCEEAGSFAPTDAESAAAAAAATQTHVPETTPAPATAETHGFGTTNVIAPVIQSRSSSGGGGGGGGDAGAGASAGRVGGSDCTSTDAANALRTWIIDTQPTGEVKTKCLGPFFTAYPWAKEMLMTYEAPSDFCKEHSSLVSYYVVDGVASISALPTVDGVPLVLSVVESTGFDFRCNVGKVSAMYPGFCHTGLEWV
jgi:hypothetical protein